MKSPKNLPAVVLATLLAVCLFVYYSTRDSPRIEGVSREVIETQADAADWQRVTHQYGAREFSPGPAVNLRPGVNGLEVVVRYITRAPQRNVVKAKLFQAVVGLLRKPA